MVRRILDFTTEVRLILWRRKMRRMLQTYQFQKKGLHEFNG